MNMRTPQIFRKRTTTDDSFVVCISDLMAGLLSIFILTLILLMLSFSEKKEEYTDSIKRRNHILQQIRSELENEGVTNVVIIEELGVLRLPEGILFDPGRADIKDTGLRVIKKIGPVLIAVLDKNRKIIDKQKLIPVETIFIEGHTDSVPINSAEFPSNWELSTKRAINTWKELEKSAPRLAQLKNDKNQPLFSCSGYAETRPREDVPVKEGVDQQENRRIDFRFSMPSPKNVDTQQNNSPIGKVSDRGNP